MPRYLLDTNICIYLIKHQPVEVAERFAQCYRGDVVMSVGTYAELQFGVAVAADPTREAGHEDIPVGPIPYHGGHRLWADPCCKAGKSKGLSRKIDCGPCRFP